MEETSRLPEGMEWLIEAWPKFEDDAPVKLGDMALIDGDADMVEAVQIWIHGKPVIYGDNGSQQLEKGEHVKRPLVIAADVEPLEAGQTVYHTDTGREYQIHSINDDGKGAFVYNNSLGQDAAGLHLCPVGNLTHQRPVLDADDVPNREGDTVYNKVTGEPGTAIVVDNDGQQFATVKSHDRGNWCDPICFTHTKPEPDSWSSVWADVSNGNETPEGMMRRCRALAERGE